MFGIILALSSWSAVAGNPPQQSWPFSGGNIENTRGIRSPPTIDQLRPDTVRNLKVKWTFTTHGNVVSTPAVEQGGLYVADRGGYIYKVDPDTGALIWQHRLSEYSGNPDSYARSSPAISESSVVFGDRGGGGWVYSVDKMTGALIWATMVNPHPSASITAAPVIYDGVVYVGVASKEEILAVTTTYQPTFRGNFAALDLATGQIKWNFMTVPAGYSGGGIPGSNPAISTALGMIFVGVGNNYSIPPDRGACVAAAGKDASSQLNCLDPTDYVDTILALDLKDGTVKWSRHLSGADTWTNGCKRADRAGCPSPEGGDDDFASAPNLVRNRAFTGVPDDRAGASQGVLLGVGQKNGIYWALNPANGGVFWSTKLGKGQIQWGSAVGDMFTKQYIFVALNNSGHNINTLAGRFGQPVVWNAGSWGALDALTGKIAWQVPSSAADLINPQFGANTPGPMTYANRIVFAGDSSGNLVALSGETGFKFWTFATGATVASGPAIFNNTLYWGVGYANGIAGHTLYAFAAPP